MCAGLERYQGSRIYDVSSLEPWHQVCYIISDQHTYGILLSGSYFYASEGNYLKIYDVSDFSSPQQISSLSTFGAGKKGLFKQDDLLYALSNNAFYIFDVSNPASPYLVDNLDLPDDARCFVVQGSRVYIANGTNGVNILNITNTGAISIVGWYHTPNIAYDIAVLGDYVYVADNSSFLGLHHDAPVENNDELLPDLSVITSLGNQPNPFKPSTTISFNVNSNIRGTASISIYNHKGQLVSIFKQSISRTGIYNVTWNGTDLKGEKLASGIYLYSISLDKYLIKGKITMIK